MKIYLNQLGMCNALGRDIGEIAPRLAAGDVSGMVREAGLLVEGEACVGRVQGELPQIPPELAPLASRNNQLLMAAVQPLRAEIERLAERYGRDRIGVVLGTSTSGIAETETAVAAEHAGQLRPACYDYRQQEMGSPAAFLSRWLVLSGISYVVSTACTSSAKALVSAYQLLTSGLCDVVLAGGVDSLCRLTLNGFNALESISPSLTNPMSAHRSGINIGEGAALFIVSREPGPVALLGYGESSDAYHISAPEPQGRGAEAAMRAALAMAGMQPQQVGYLNLHGTATPKNDEMESLATQRVFGSQVPASSTKPLVGHTLGAAGATELGFGWLLLSQDNPSLPPHRWDGARDPAVAELNLVSEGMRLDLARRVILSSSFAFGGNNVCLLIGAEG